MDGTGYKVVFRHYPGSNASQNIAGVRLLEDLSYLDSKRGESVGGSERDQDSSSGLTSSTAGISSLDSRLRNGSNFYSVQSRNKGGAAKLLRFPSDNSACVDPLLPSINGIIDNRIVDSDACNADNCNADNDNGLVTDNSNSVICPLPPPAAESTATEVDNALCNVDEGGKSAMNATAPQHQLSWVAPLVASTPTRRKYAETEKDG